MYFENGTIDYWVQHLLHFNHLKKIIIMNFLFLPLKIVATSLLNRPNGLSSASIRTHFLLIVDGVALNVLLLIVFTGFSVLFCKIDKSKKIRVKNVYCNIKKMEISHGLLNSLKGTNCKSLKTG